MGAIGSTARSLTTKSQTNLVLSVRSACFATQERNAPCSRLLLMSSAIGEASRRISVALAGRSLAAIILILADMRSIAAFGVFGCARAVLDCLASLRTAERMQRSLLHL